jgi:hypothetical protein
MELRDDHQRDYKDDFALQDFHDRHLANNSPRWAHTQMPLPGDKRQLIE